MSKRLQIIIAGISGFLAVALGAFGAHGLKNIIDAGALETYKTGVLYHLVHSTVLLAIALNGNEKYKFAFISIACGIILFSFSLYLYSLSRILIFAMITPFGGISFLIGWLFIIIKSYKENE